MSETITPETFKYICHLNIWRIISSTMKTIVLKILNVIIFIVYSTTYWGYKNLTSLNPNHIRVRQKIISKDILLGSLYSIPVRTPGVIPQVFFHTVPAKTRAIYHIVDEHFFSSLIEKHVCLINHCDTYVSISQSSLHLLQSSSSSKFQADENPQELEKGSVRNVPALSVTKLKVIWTYFLTERHILWKFYTITVTIYKNTTLSYSVKKRKEILSTNCYRYCTVSVRFRS